MTKSKGFAPKTAARENTFALTTAADSAIETTATEIVVLPINADAQVAFSEFKARPGIAATIGALAKAKDGFVAVWAEENEHEYGRSFFEWLWSIFVAIALPLFSLLWLAINKGYVWSRKPETRAKAAEKWQVVKGWFGAEAEVDEAALKL